MKYNDHEFDPVTDEERAAREREEELARRIRREVLRERPAPGVGLPGLRMHGRGGADVLPA